MKALLKRIRELLRNRRFRKYWYRGVSTFAAIVVFVTTYALVLPAITLERTAACGIEEHQHDDSCFTEELVCGLPESYGHHHTEDCYEVTQVLVCDNEEHAHGDNCFDEEGNLICEKPEHVHSVENGCYEEERTLICGQEESEGHHHDSSCYEKVLTCGKEVHVHSAACYEEDEVSTDSIESAAVAASTGAAAVEIDDSGDADDVNEANNAFYDGSVSTDTTVDTNTDGAGVTDASAAATINVLPEETAPEDLSDGYVPVLDPVDMASVLDQRAGFYYFDASAYAEEHGQEIPANSSDITEWKKYGNDDRLESSDLLRLYLSYTIPAGTLNSTNQVARYRLPANIHLTDDQIIAINETVNGVAGGYVNYDTLEITDPDKYEFYRGAEAVEGTRTPADRLNDYLYNLVKAGKDGQEYICAVVKAENVFNEVTGEYEGQDLIFIFTPYSIEKNQNEYDHNGQPVKAGEKIAGWFACDFNCSQIDWTDAGLVGEDETEPEIEPGTTEKKADVILVNENKAAGIKEVRETLILTDHSADMENGQADAASTEPAGDDATETAEEGGVAENATIEEAAGNAANADTNDEDQSKDNKDNKDTAQSSGVAGATGEASDKEKTDADKETEYKSGTLKASGTGYTITLDYTAEAQIPPDAELQVTEITAESDPAAYEACLEEARKQVVADDNDKTTVDTAATRFFDIEILAPAMPSGGDDEAAESGEERDKQKIEPKAAVAVNIQLRNSEGISGSGENTASNVSSRAGEDAGTVEKAPSEDALSGELPSGNAVSEEPTVLHFADSGVETLDATVNDGFREVGSGSHVNGTKMEASKDIQFEASSFSIYGVIYTVDFKYEVNGKIFEFSLGGGSTASFRDLVQALHVLDDREGENKDIDAFLNDIVSIEFSDENLVRVAQITEGITAGALKQKLGLESEYSAELTKEQAADLDSRIFYAPDWALISLKAFDTAETLTVTMNDGEVFTIAVTDAQIKKTFMTASGETWEISVTYGEEAGIPDGAELKVREVEPDTEEYAEYLTEAAQKAELKSDKVSFARFFDIEILDEEKHKVEPEAPVSVELVYKDALDIGLDEKLSVVHFAEEGTEVIGDISLSDDHREISYEQNSFSVTGTIVGNPENGRNYALIVDYNGSYYCIQNDGSLKPVDYTGSGPLAVDSETPLENPQMWTYDNNNLYYNYIQVGFNGGKAASDYYRRYLDPRAADAFTEEDSTNTTDTTGQTGVGNGIIVNSRPVAGWTKINYTNNRIKQSDGNNYIGIAQNNNDLQVIGQCDSDHAARIILAEIRTLPAIKPESELPAKHSVQHIDISIQGTADLNVPLAYGSYYGTGGKDAGPVMVVDKDHHVTLELSQNVPINMQDIMNADIRAYVLENGNKVELPDAFYVTGYSKNAETTYSTDQVRVDGVFKVANLEDWGHYGVINGPWGPYQGWINDSKVTDPNAWHERLENRVYYTVSTTKQVDFPLVYEVDGQEYPLCDENGDQIIRKITVTLSASFDYWDLENECPPLQEEYLNLDGYMTPNHDGRENWKRGDIPNHGMSGMDFVLGAGAESSSDHVAIEINKYLVNEGGDLISPDTEKTYDFDVYHGTKDPDSFKELNVNEYTSEPDYSGYVNIHDKGVSVGEGGFGVTYDYDVTPGSIYVEEDQDSIDDVLVDERGNVWYYDHTYMNTEYVWRKTGDEKNLHFSDTYTKQSDNMNSVPEIIGPYIADEWYEDYSEFKTEQGANEFRDTILSNTAHYRNISAVFPVQKQENGQAVTRWRVSYVTDSANNGFLEFFVYNVYKPQKSLNIEVEKEWENDNPEDDAEINIRLGRYKLVKEGAQVQGTGNLVIRDSYSGLGSGSSYHAVYTVTGQNYTSTFHGTGSPVTVENLTPGVYTVTKTVSEVDGYTLNQTEASVTASVPENDTGRAVLPESVFTRSGEQAYHVRVHWADGDYNWVNSYYPADNLLNFNVGVPDWMSANGYFSYSMDGGATFQTIGAGDTISEPFLLDHDYDIQIRYTRISADWGPAWGGWLNGPTITGADPIATTFGAPRRLAKSGTVTGTGSVTIDGITPELPAAPDGYHYELDEEYAQKPHTFRLTNGSWTATASGLDVGDANGEYLYFIAQVSESGLPDGTVATVVDEITSNSSGKVLTVRNNVPLVDTFGDVSFSKRDHEGLDVPGAVFALYKKYTNGVVSSPLKVRGDYVTAESGANGLVEFTDIPEGVYYMKETTAPEGYKLSPVIYKVTIKDKTLEDPEDPSTQSRIETISDQPETVTVIINEESEYGEVEFEKQDMGNTLLDGAVFTLYTNSTCSEIVTAGGEAVTAASSGGGKVKLTASRMIRGEEKTGIETGDYYMRETSAPNGYQLSDRKYFVHIGNDQDGDSSFIAPAEENPVTGDKTLAEYYRAKAVNSVENEPLTIYVKKVDDNNKVLTGARFTLSGSAFTAVTKPNANEEDNGTYSFSGLMNGSYTLHETAPEGYTAVEDITFEVEGGTVKNVSGPAGVTWNEETFTITVKNEPDVTPGNIVIRKQWMDFFGNAEQPDVNEINLTLKRYKDVPQTKYLHVVVVVAGNNGNERIETRNIAITNDTARVSWYDASQFYWDSGRIPTPVINDTNITASDATNHYQWPNDQASQNTDAVWNLSNLSQASQNTVEVTFTYNIRGTDIDADWFYNTIRGRSVNVVQSGNPVQGGNGVPEEDSFSDALTLRKSGNWRIEKTVNDQGGDYPATDGNGNAYHYFIEEDSIPAGYAVTYSTNNQEGVQAGILTVYNKKTTIDIDIEKVDKTDHSDKLEGARFELRRIDESSASLSYLGAMINPETNGESFKTGTDGYAAFHGLTPGYYEVYEADIPDGYVSSGDDRFYFKITEDGIYHIRKSTGAPSTWRAEPNNEMIVFSNGKVTVSNESGAELPHTGGPGTKPIHLLGGLLTGLGLLLLLDRKRTRT